MSKTKREKTNEELTYQKSFGNQLKELLKTIEITQIEFSKQIGVHYNTVNRWVKGLVFPEPLIQEACNFLFNKSQTKRF